MHAMAAHVAAEGITGHYRFAAIVMSQDLKGGMMLLNLRELKSVSGSFKIQNCYPILERKSVNGSHVIQKCYAILES